MKQSVRISEISVNQRLNVPQGQNIDHDQGAVQRSGIGYEFGSLEWTGEE